MPRFFLPHNWFGLAEALIGFKFALKHMDERTLVISSQAGDVIKPGAKKVVLGEGMPIKVKKKKKRLLARSSQFVFVGNAF